MIKTYFKSVVLAAYLLFVGISGSFAQCKNIAKKQCFPALAPYVQNGQFNSARLSPGENAEVALTFYAATSYRLLVCSEAVLGDVSYKVIDVDKNELFNSKKAESKQFDFNVATTQQLFVIVDVPPLDSPNKISPEGCVSILVGFTTTPVSKNVK